MANQFRAAPRGTLRLSAPVAFGQLWLAPRLTGFMDACPDVDLRVTLIDRPVDLIDDGVDLAIRIADHWPAGLVVRKLLPVRYVLVASPDYLARYGTPKVPADLVSHRCLHLGHGAFGATWQMHRDSDVKTITIGSRITLNNSIAIASAAEASAGIGLIPDFSARSGLEAGRLVEILPAWHFGAPYKRDVAVLYLPGPNVPHKIRAFVDFLVSTL